MLSSTPHDGVAHIHDIPIHPGATITAIADPVETSNNRATCASVPLIMSQYCN
jgi:hypothetical protein